MLCLVKLTGQHYLAGVEFVLGGGRGAGNADFVQKPGLGGAGVLREPRSALGIPGVFCRLALAPLIYSSSWCSVSLTAVEYVMDEAFMFP